MNLLFFETSAKTGANIKSLFNELAKKLTGIETIANPDDNKPARTEGFQLGGANDPAAGDAAAEGGKPARKKGGCCGGGGKNKLGWHASKCFHNHFLEKLDSRELLIHTNRPHL